MKKIICLLMVTAFLLIASLSTVSSNSPGETRQIMNNENGAPVIITDQNEITEQAKIHGAIVPEGKKLVKIEFATN